MFVIYEVGVHLRRGEILLENKDPENPMYSLRSSIKSLMFCPVMQSLFSRLISARICFYP